MSRIFVHGLGAVSPAGWSVDDLCDIWRKKIPLPDQDLPRPGLETPLATRNVPPPDARPAFLTHPRLRRATAMAQYAVGSGLEAIGCDAEQIRAGELRLGIVVCALSGCVNYSRRFYEEVLREPATASPLIFPETVFNSSASHLGAILNTNAISYTLVGDGGTFLQGLALAAGWLLEGRVDACVVIGAEENDWIVSEALRLFSCGPAHAAGAGALYLKKDFFAGAVELAAVTDSFSCTPEQNRNEAGMKMLMQLPPDAAKEMFFHDEIKTIFGDAFTAGVAWQCVIACNAIRRGEADAINAVFLDDGQQAIGARLVRAV